MKYENFNRKVDYNDKIHILIVGTYTTPEGFAHGYFYSSSYNRMYSVLSRAFEESEKDEHTFRYLKTKLICENDQKTKDDVIDEINKKLEEHGMAFFDIVKTADRKEPYSPSDDNLYDIDWDRSTYERIKGNIKKIIFTSKKAESWFKKHFNQSDDIKPFTLTLRTVNDDDIKKLSNFINEDSN